MPRQPLSRHPTAARDTERAPVPAPPRGFFAPAAAAQTGAGYDFTTVPRFPGGAGSAASGRPLADPVRARMEAALGHDFSAVRVHESDEAARLGARAFTRGTHLHFAPGQYRPHAPGGRALLGHELGHVVQQSRGRVRPTGGVGALPVNADPALEREADALGARAAQAAPSPAPATPIRPLAPAPSGAAPAQMSWKKKALGVLGMLGSGAMLAGGLMASLPGLAVAGAVGLGVGAVAGLGYLGYRAYKHFSGGRPARPAYRALGDGGAPRDSGRAAAAPARDAGPRAAASAEGSDAVHARHQAEFYRMLESGDKGAPQAALWSAARNYGMAHNRPDRPAYHLQASPDLTQHFAITQGGFEPDGSRSTTLPAVTFNQTYLDRARGYSAEGRARHFAHVTHTLLHEHTHVRQRSSRAAMHPSASVREAEAYSAETLDAGHLPPLHPDDQAETAGSALGHFEAAEKSGDLARLQRDRQQELEARRKRLAEMARQSGGAASASASSSGGGRH
jgi:hypothetical protein